MGRKKKSPTVQQDRVQDTQNQQNNESINKEDKSDDLSLVVNKSIQKQQLQPNEVKTKKEKDVEVVIPMKKRRIYRAKESLLTELCSKDKNIEALYHVLILMILVGIVYSLLVDTVEAGRPHIDIRYYKSGFGPLDHQIFTAMIWIGFQAVAFSVYPCFKLWEYLHKRVGLVVDVIFFGILGLYNVLGYAVVIWVITHYDMFPVTALILNVEQLRFSMKSYSFVRENGYKVLYPWSKDDRSGPAVWYQGQMSPKVGSFSHYCYFLFCPTLLYRDNYPRTPKIRWIRVLSFLIKCSITIAFIAVLTKSIFFLPPTNSKNIISTFLTCSLWGLLYMFMTGYFFLHSWLNLFSELCRFADREFYSDWWTCHDFASFYRKWNLLVHDWIKAYIYSDLKDFFKSPLYNKVAFLPTILISGIFHEYALWAPLRFIMPCLLFLFGLFGSVLFIIRPSPNVKFWNYFLHFGLHFGVSTMIFLYTMEFYSRILCPREETFVNTFVPRFYDCYYTISANKTETTI